MSVTTRQASRNQFVGTVPVLMPLYSHSCPELLIASEGRVLFGRGNQCHFSIEQQGIESRHCSLNWQDGILSVQRLDGRIWVNDLPINQDRQLIPGDLLSVGPVTFQVQTTAAPIAPAVFVQPAESVSSTGLTPSPKATSAARLVEATTREAAERLSVLEGRERLLSIREQQFQSSFASLQQELVQQKADMERRLIQLDDRERYFAEQVESSAVDHARMEQSRNVLSVRMDAISTRETINDAREAELQRLETVLQEKVARISEELKISHVRAEGLDAREETLKATASALAIRESSAIQTEQQLSESSSALRSDLSNRLEAVRQQEAKIESRRQELEQLAASIDESSVRIAAESHLNVVREEQLNAREAVLLEREQHITASLQSQDLQTLRSSEADDNSELESQRTELAAALREQATLREQLSNAQQEMARLSSQLHGKSAALERHVVELAHVKQQAEENLSRGTRSVEQLTAIAAEREASLRVREEALQSLNDVKALTAALAAQKVELLTWQIEIDSRHAELADRVKSMKAIRARWHHIDITSQQNEASLIDQATSIREQQSRIEQRQLELAESEVRVNDREQSARVELRNAEVERDSLRNSYKDLQCERNSLTQLSQDLQSRASGLSEREAIVVQQTAELRSRFLAMNQQSSELQKTESELNLRAADLHRRIIEFKQELSEQKTKPLVVDTENRAESCLTSPVEGSSAEEAISLSKLSEQLRESELQREATLAERDALMTAVRELQRAMLNARADVEEAGRVRAEAAGHEQTLSTLYQTIEERSGQLQLMESKLRKSEEDSEELRRQLLNLQSGHTAGKLEHVADSRITDKAASSDQEETLLLEIESLQGQLKSSAGNDSERLAQFQNSLGERDEKIDDLLSRIDELQLLLSNASSTVEQADPVSTTEIDELNLRIARAEVALRDRDDLIRELRARLLQPSKQEPVIPTENIDQEELQKEAREMDRRAVLLDDRDEELRERLRKVTQSEEEVESQRRQLLDARQQLEIARAEIQVAMKQHSSVSGVSNQIEATLRSTVGSTPHALSTRAGSALFGNEPEEASNRMTTEQCEDEASGSSQDLRAELANLFGLKKPVAAQQSPEIVPATEFADTSEPTGASKAVAYHFGEDASEIVRSPNAAFNGDAPEEPVREENSDSFVKDYMEQLLARSRKAAGNSLPSELKNQTGKGPAASSGPAAASAKKNDGKSTPKVKSFIDEYMAGGFGDLTGDGSMSSPPPLDEVEVSDQRSERQQPEIIIPRAKVDLQKLRENMDSFRTLSTQSLENALVDHALRTERLSINGRIMLMLVMVFMTAFLALAHSKRIITQPSLIWVAFMGSIGAGMELGRKWYSVKARGRVALRPEGQSVSELGNAKDRMAAAVFAAQGSHETHAHANSKSFDTSKNQLQIEAGELGMAPEGHSDDAIKNVDNPEYFEL